MFRTMPTLKNFRNQNYIPDYLAFECKSFILDDYNKINVSNTVSKSVSLSLKNVGHLEIWKWCHRFISQTKHSSKSIWCLVIDDYFRLNVLRFGLDSCLNTLKRRLEKWLLNRVGFENRSWKDENSLKSKMELDYTI